MRALTVLVGAGNSARLDDLPELVPKADTLLIQGIAVGVCSTDREIIEGGLRLGPTGEEAVRPRCAGFGPSVRRGVAVRPRPTWRQEQAGRLRQPYQSRRGR